ncbi:MAG: family transcriptional regulator, cyclic receptor protein [Gaiellaceae bacterium]|nr:family transcriptional regulator, cyclic receptor protein [Gaiellaceae bacterium]
MGASPTLAVRPEPTRSAPVVRVTLAAGAVARIPSDTALAVVEEGVLLVRATVHGRAALLTIAGAGEVVPTPSKAEALQAATPVRLRIVSERELESLLASPADTRWLVDGLAAALRDRQDSLAYVAAATHAERLEAKLIQLARKHGRVTPRGIRIDVPLTHQLLAESIGAARETVTVALRDLRRRGLVVREGRAYLVQMAPRSLG